MKITDLIALAQSPPVLPALVIGGYAVAAHGYQRATYDVDFLVRMTDRAAWMERLIHAGFQAVSQTHSFAQLTQGPTEEGLDLMFVETSTFEPMWQASEIRHFGEIVGRIPSLNHLLALKLHVLKQANPQRTSKDARDIEILARHAGLDLETESYRRLFLKYGKSTRPSDVSSGDPTDLDSEAGLIFPEAEPFSSTPPPISLSRMMELNRDFRKWFPESVPTEDERLRMKVDVEFRL